MGTTISEQALPPLVPGFYPLPNRPMFYDEQRQVWLKHLPVTFQQKYTA